jgi:hypothetical protein
MRKGSVAIVPLFLAIVTLFWFIWFMGGENDNLHRVNELENLHHLQERLLLPAMKRRYELAEADPSLSDVQLDEAVDAYIDEMMVLNEIH